MPAQLILHPVELSCSLVAQLARYIVNRQTNNSEGATELIAHHPYIATYTEVFA
jgi:hypothetical protein